MPQAAQTGAAWLLPCPHDPIVLSTEWRRATGRPLKQLRSWYASLRAEEGMPMPVLQRILGHTTIGVTSRYYIGINDDVSRDWVSKARPLVAPKRTVDKKVAKRPQKKRKAM
jgi:integrase